MSFKAIKYNITFYSRYGKHLRISNQLKFSKRIMCFKKDYDFS